MSKASSRKLEELYHNVSKEAADAAVKELRDTGIHVNSDAEAAIQDAVFEQLLMQAG